MVTVSVVIPTRGRAELLRRAIRSAQNQTLRDIEIAVVIDGPDPAAALVVKEMQNSDPRLRLVSLPESVGGSDARNRGVDASRGEWIAFLDDDDEWFPHKLQVQLDVVSQSAAKILIGTCRMIARTPEQDYIWPRRLPSGDEPIGEYLLARRSLTRGEGYIQTSTFFVRRSLMLAEPFKSGQLKHQDTEWVLRLGAMPGAEVVFADQVLAVHNIEENRTTVSSKSNWQYSLDWLRRDRHLFSPRALAAFALYQIASEAADQGAWRAFPQLLVEALRYGKTGPREYAIFFAIWLLPRRRRRRLRNWMAHHRFSRSLVASS